MIEEPARSARTAAINNLMNMMLETSARLEGALDNSSPYKSLDQSHNRSIEQAVKQASILQSN